MAEEDENGCGVSIDGALLGGFAGLFACYLYLVAGAGAAIAWGAAAGGGGGGAAFLIVGGVFFGGGALVGGFVVPLIFNVLRPRHTKRGTTRASPSPRLVRPKRVSEYPRLKRPKRRR